MNNRLSDDDLDRLKNHLVGTCATMSAALQYLELDVDQSVAEDQLLDGNSVERCGGCRWWFDTSDLTFNEAKSVPECDQCKEEDE